MIPTYQEIGTLRSLPEGESQFIGSSSGIFFVNTVRRTFAAVAASSTDPSPEDCIIDTDQPTQKDSNVSSAYVSGPMPTPTTEKDPLSSRLEVTCDIGTPPSYELARELMMIYFRVWHPIFPFLHGPTFLQELELFYSENESSSSLDPTSMSRAVTLQCVFNIAILDCPDLRTSASLAIPSPDHLLPLLGILALRCDAASIQALLAAQLYLISTMSLRAASSVGGLVWRSILKAGLHRCPYRYSHLQSHDRDIRKRIFWTAYTIDRFLSQALGHILGIQDSDFDVCLPGSDDHNHLESQENSNLGHSPDASRHMAASTSPSRGMGSYASSSATGSDASVENGIALEDDADTRYALQRRRDQQSVLPYYVEYSKLTGRVLEMFHKSIHVRSTDQNAILCLKADIDAWWNGLPTFLQVHNIADSTQQHPLGDNTIGETPNWGAFFSIEYHHLILLAKRPSLSLDPSAPEFRSALQTCIAAARTIIYALEAKTKSGKSPFWPGLLSGAWMSGLIIVFACQLNLYTLSKGYTEASACLNVLEVMTRRWPMAKHCHKVLSSLVANIQQKSSKRGHGFEQSCVDQNNKAKYSDTNDRHIDKSGPVTRGQDELPPAKRRRPNLRRERNQSADTSVVVSVSNGSPAFIQVLDEEDERHIHSSPLPSMNCTHDSSKPDAISTVPYDIVASLEAQQSAQAQWTAQNPMETGSASSLSLMYTDLNTDYNAVASAEHSEGPNNWRQRGPLTPLGLYDPSGFDIFGGVTWESLIDIMDVQRY